MKIKYSPEFYIKLKTVDVRIRKKVKDSLLIFSKNPIAPQLNNHPLRNPYQNHRSIDADADYRVLYKEINENNEIIAYFTTFGTHRELYG